MDDATLSAADFFDDHDQFGSDDHVNKLASGDDLFSILESLEADVVDFPALDETTGFVAGSKFESDQETTSSTRLVSQKSTSSSTFQELSETELDQTLLKPKSKRAKLSAAANHSSTTSEEEAALNPSDGQGKMSHITVERNRRKQMNEHLSVLRSLMPCFYVKRGDQASIIGGVVDYITELQQVLQSLEAKKQRKIYSEVLSPRVVSSPRASPVLLSPRKPPLSPRLISSLPISPRTPQPGSPYKPPRLQQSYLINSPTMPTSTTTTTTNSTSNTSLEPSPTSSSTSSNINNDNVNELFANSKSAVADVEVKFSGSNVLLKTVSPRIPGQAVKIIAALEDLSLEILDVSINTIDETMLNSFTIKIGIECQLSAEELAHQIQQTFC
ncbi:Basic helix-loop-helix transcription factor [Trema orientale]|uniref:Basic helix-loop-helix transcription factor n=1 Tax=Trema orientale TaxID=63057 RepID=A0A2P5FGF7_TREOI|nr:Basic helix-loop-helix transcription factor [Trema orientale]